MLNWLLRYAPVVDLVRGPDGRLASSVLDVGCGPHGLACAMPEAEFTGVDVLFPERVAPTMTAVRADPGPLPFADAAFGTVVCLDVLEHVPAPERAGLVAELARVAAERVVVACPVQEAQRVDDHIRSTYRLTGQAEPVWLREHYEEGLPSAASVAAACTAVPGFSATPLPMPNGLLNAAVAILETSTPFGLEAAEASRAQRDAWLEVFNAARFGDAWRGAWVLERIEARRPLVDPSDVPGGTRAALRCPGCGSPMGPCGTDVACTGCDRTGRHDGAGALDLTRPGWYAAPGWRPEQVRAVVERFLAAHPDRGSLVLYADPDECDEATAVRLVVEAVGEREVAGDLEIEVVTRPLERPEDAGRVLVA